jgi:hypothetical protein
VVEGEREGGWGRKRCGGRREKEKRQLENFEIKESSIQVEKRTEKY